MLLPLFIVNLNILDRSQPWSLNYIVRILVFFFFFFCSLSALSMFVFFRDLFIIFINRIRNVSVEFWDNFSQNFECRLGNILFIRLYQNCVCYQKTVSVWSLIKIRHRKSHIKNHARFYDSVIISLNWQLFLLFI